MIVTVLCYTITYKNALDVPNTLNKIYNTCYALTICGSLKYLGSQCIVGKSSLCTYCVHICLCAIFLADTVYLGYINVGYGWDFHCQIDIWLQPWAPGLGPSAYYTHPNVPMMRWEPHGIHLDIEVMWLICRTIVHTISAYYTTLTKISQWWAPHTVQIDGAVYHRIKSSHRVHLWSGFCLICLAYYIRTLHLS